MKLKGKRKRLLGACVLATTLMAATAGGLITLNQDVPVANAAETTTETTLETTYLVGMRSNSPRIYWRLDETGYTNYDKLATDVLCKYTNNGSTTNVKVNIQYESCGGNAGPGTTSAHTSGTNYPCLLFSTGSLTNLAAGATLTIPSGTVLKDTDLVTDKYVLDQDYTFVYRGAGTSNDLGWAFDESSAKIPVGLTGSSQNIRSTTVFQAYCDDFLADYYATDTPLSTVASADFITTTGTSTATVQLTYTTSPAGPSAFAAVPTMQVEIKSGESATVGDKVVLKKGTTVFDNFTFDRDYTFTYIGTNDYGDSYCWSMTATTDANDPEVTFSGLRGGGSSGHINVYLSQPHDKGANQHFARHAAILVNGETKYVHRMHGLAYGGSGDYSIGIQLIESGKGYTAKANDIVTFEEGTYILGYRVAKDTHFMFNGSAWSIVQCDGTTTHTYAETYTCKDRACVVCGAVDTGDGNHIFAETYSCVDRTCTACSTVVTGDGNHVTFGETFTCGTRECACGASVTGDGNHTAAEDDGDCTTEVLCKDCSEVTIAKDEHDFTGDYEKDESGHWHVCQNAGCTQTDTKENHTEKDSDCSTPDTCGTCGYVAPGGTHKYTDDGNCTTEVKCENCQTPVIEAKAAHTPSAEVAKVDATCMATGTSAHYRCTVEGCDVYLTKNGEAYTEVDEEALIIAIDVNAHTYGEASYTWSPDNKTCTANRVCEYNEEHGEGETVNVTTSVTEATCTEDEYTTYTATFNNGAFATQKKENVKTGDATGHDFTSGGKFCDNDCGYRVAYTAEDMDEILALDSLVKYTYNDAHVESSSSVMNTLDGTGGNSFLINTTKTGEKQYQYDTGKESTHDMLVSFSFTATDWAFKGKDTRSSYVWLNAHENGNWGIGFLLNIHSDAQNVRIVYKPNDVAANLVTFGPAKSLTGFALNEQQSFEFGVVQNSDGSYFAFAYYNGSLLTYGTLAASDISNNGNEDNHYGLGGAVAFRFNGSETVPAIKGTICDLEHSIQGTQYECKAYDCQYCGADIDATANHSWGDGELTGSGSCEEKQVFTCTCATCGDTTTYEGDYVHDWDYDNPTIVTPAACGGVDEVVKYACKLCGDESENKTNVGSSANLPSMHDYEYESIEDATCVAAGKMQGTCTHCNAKSAIFDTDIDEEGHAYGTEIAEEPATCTEEGLAAHYVCSLCGKSFTEADGVYTEVSADDLVIAAGHAYGAEIAEEPATCTEEGVAAHYACSVCGKLFTEANGVYTEVSADDLVIAAGHKYQFVAAIAATADADGMAEHYKCTLCNKLYTLVNGTYTETTAEALRVAYVPDSTPDTPETPDDGEDDVAPDTPDNGEGEGDAAEEEEEDGCKSSVSAIGILALLAVGGAAFAIARRKEQQ